VFWFGTRFIYHRIYFVTVHEVSKRCHVGAVCLWYFSVL